MKKSIFILSIIFSFKAFAEIASGDDCGKNCRWSISDEGTLTVWAGDDNGGKGSIGKYKFTSDKTSTTAPWGAYKDDIKNIDIQEGITDLGKHAFARISSTNPVILPESITSISNTGLGYIRAPEIVIPNSVTSIESSAFAWTSTCKVDIPSSVTQIGSYAFRGTGMTDMVIPDTVLSIADAAFSAPKNLKSLVIGENTSVGNIFYYNNEIPDLSNLKMFCSASNVTSCADALRAVGVTDENIANTLKTYSKDANGFYQIDDSLYANATLMAHGAACDDAANCQAILDAASQGEPFMVGGKYYATIDLFANRAACTSLKNCEDMLQAASQNAPFKVGSKIYHSLEDFANGDYDKKRIYTIDEANFVSGKKNSVTIRYK